MDIEQFVFEGKITSIAYNKAANAEDYQCVLIDDSNKNYRGFGKTERLAYEEAYRNLINGRNFA